MKPIRMSFALLVLMGAAQFTGLLYAQAAEPGPEDDSAIDAEPEPNQSPASQEPASRVTEWAREVGTVVDGVSLEESDIADYVSHREGFESAVHDETGWAKLSVNLKEGYDLIVKSEAYVKWAKENGLEPVDWLKKAVRIKVLSYRLRADAELPELKQRVELRKALVEAEKHGLSTSDFVNVMAALEMTRETLDELSDVLKTLPSASDAEKAAMALKSEELR